jgi:Flp pilus assembly pilin Flp
VRTPPDLGAPDGQPQRDAEAGQGLVEYGLILGLAALVTVTSLVFFGGVVALALSLLGQAIDSST